MMTSPSDQLNFDCKPHIYSMLVKSLGDQTNDHQQTQKLEEFVARLEEERLKIDAFKRELPLCMQLLTNAMEASRQQLQSQIANQEANPPVLEQFIPLKNAENQENSSADKANWMTSAQLWNQESEETRNPNQDLQSPLITSPPPPHQHHQETEIKLGLNGKQRINGGGAFLPFSSKDRVSPAPCAEGFPELALASSHKEEMEDKKSSPETNSRRENSGKGGGDSGGEKEQVSGNGNTNQTHRKARRCWSPDLHRRFVNALHMLGGSQVATPKQIRELMKVDGLTNDEVKSHLQKYRLHTRRPSPSPQTTVTAAPRVVVLGGIWVPPEYAAAAAHAGGSQAAALYGAHAAATHHVSPSFCSPGGPQEIYPAIAPPPPPPNHQNHAAAAAAAIHQQQLLMYNKPPLTQRNSSPESDFQGGAGDPSESIEDGKSESGSWKADSGGDNGGERRRLEGEESNASVVGLKF